MAVRDIIGPGFVGSGGTIRWIVTRGFSSGAAPVVEFDGLLEVVEETATVADISVESYTTADVIDEAFEAD